MAVFVGICAALQILGAIAIYAVARSAIHEILAATMFGMGIIAFALGVLIENSNKQLAAIERLKSTS
ncbi:hypothetical protein [Mesorhizobium sp. DCY119]|uniref:hypothetical protein n=1 Tax=Mesorhizobium sp. DCY119 TaxID=2108445 RepID=UPI000E6CEBBD|nr:hypothetical protein [Mesorhizobium sp. DCY119]RJG44907.1 hypothetical protein D3Y55_11940 [Mesorhizobium sp. DCY119]